MRPDGPITDLTEAQKKMAMIAGIPADRPGLGAEYPKMVFRPGRNDRHQLENKPIKMGNGPAVNADKLSEGFDNEIAYVDSPEDEEQTLADGWYLSPTPEGQKAERDKRAAENAKDAEIAALKAQIASQGEQPQTEKRGPGRPPKTDAN